MVKHVDVLQRFINGEVQSKAGNLYIENDKLFNHSTVIAERDLTGDEPQYTVNITKYSQSTTTIQNRLSDMLQAQNKNYSFINNIRMGAKKLKDGATDVKKILY